MGGESRSPKEGSRGRRMEFSVVEVAGRGLVELEVGHGLGIGGIEARCLVEREVPLRWPASGRERGRPVGEALTPRDNVARGPRFEVEEDDGDDGRVGEEGEDAHGPAAGGTEER